MKRVSMILLLASPVFADDISFDRIATVDAPGSSVEIVKYSDRDGLLLATDPEGHMLHILRVEGFDTPTLQPVRHAVLAGVPNSVVIHPRLPIALVAVANTNSAERGAIAQVDLITGETTFVPAGYHPDSLALSPNGKWLIVANEGEGEGKEPGSIFAYDLPSFERHELAGLAELLGRPVAEIEPEHVAFDPMGRFAVVSCQENDAVVMVDTGLYPPALVSKIELPPGSHPDGVDSMDELIAIAEEDGQSVSLYRINPSDFATTFMSRVDVRPLMDPDQLDKKRQPEAVAFGRLGATPLLFAGIERGDAVICFDVSDPANPRYAGRAKTGDRPEGLYVVAQGESLVVITGDEGKGGPGTITFSRAER